MNTMKLSGIVGLGCAVIVSLASLAGAQQPEYGQGGSREDQPHMQKALEHLQQAQEELRAAEHDKGGHRQQAIQFIDQAKQEVRAGIQYDDQHRSANERGEMGGTYDSNNSVRITGGPTIELLDDHSAVIAWDTNVQGSSRVEYGQNRNDLSQIAESPWGAGGLTHRVRIDNLRPDTTYFFEVETEQARGSGAGVESNRILSFRTLPQGSRAMRDQQPR